MAHVFVFHAVRPTLRAPFEHPENRRILTAVRDALGIERVVFPFRAIEEVLLSELNRLRAIDFGDWAFPRGWSGWNPPFTEAQLASASFPPELEPLSADKARQPETLFAHLLEKTGKFFAIYELFTSVFDEVMLLDYRSFIDRPHETFAALGARCGFSCPNSELFHVKINSLANRLLVYNPVDVCIDGVELRFRLELAPVLPLCADWGGYEVLPLGCSPWLSEIESEFGVPLALGIHKASLRALPAPQRAWLCDERRLAERLGPVLGLFYRNYCYLKSFYRAQVHLPRLRPAWMQWYEREYAEDLARFASVIDKSNNSIIATAAEGPDV